jgi:hypothetical protein
MLYAAWKGHYDVAKKLIELGVRLNYAQSRVIFCDDFVVVVVVVVVNHILCRQSRYQGHGTKSTHMF